MLDHDHTYYQDEQGSCADTTTLATSNGGPIQAVQSNSHQPLAAEILRNLSQDCAVDKDVSVECGISKDTTETPTVTVEKVVHDLSGSSADDLLVQPGDSQGISKCTSKTCYDIQTKDLLKGSKDQADTSELLKGNNDQADTSELLEGSKDQADTSAQKVHTTNAGSLEIPEFVQSDPVQEETVVAAKRSLGDWRDISLTSPDGDRQKSVCSESTVASSKAKPRKPQKRNTRKKGQSGKDSSATEKKVTKTGPKTANKASLIMRQSLENTYTSALAATQPRRAVHTPGGYWNVAGQREGFECLCGKMERPVDFHDSALALGMIRCGDCHLWQHAKCVNYDTNDVARVPFLCPHCLLQRPPTPSGATLIVSPSSICHQWVDEISKHVRPGAVRVLVYEGVHKKGFIQPATLAQQYDIVVTTYEVLRTEINYVDLPHSNSTEGRRFRNPKRYIMLNVNNSS